MAGSLPTVRGGASCCTPVTRRVEFLTDVAIANNATEQRMKQRPPLTRFILPYTGMRGTEFTAFKNFFNSQKGAFDATWSFTHDGTTYNKMVFEDSVFSFKEDPGTPTYYSFTLKARQTQNSGQTAGSPNGAFPALANGARTQLPYTQMRRFAVMLNANQACGVQYSWVWFGGGLTGFPSAALHGWELSYATLSNADAATIETHFRNQWGRWGGFSFTDPDDSTAYSNCRYDSDTLEIVNNGPNLNAITLRILETNG